MFDVRGKVAIVTGGVRGFGKEFAVRLLKAGIRGVCLADIDVQLGDKVANELGSDKVIFSKCDVSDESDWKNTWEKTERAFQTPVSLLINNAGLNPLHGWHKCIQVMLMGTANGSFLAVEKMSKVNGGSGGRIVNLCSIAAFMSSTGRLHHAGYGVAKSAIASFTRNFADPFDARGDIFASDGVKAYALCPTHAQTELMTSLCEGDREVGDTIMKLAKVVRMLTVEEVGDALMAAIERDSNGSCYVVCPNSPLLDIPNVNMAASIAFIAIGTLLGKLNILSRHQTLSSFQGLFITAVLIAAILYLFVKLLCLTMF